MTKQSYSSSVNDAFDRTYSEVYSEDYLSGVRPEDEPRLIIKDSFFVISLVALFVFLGFVAVRYF